MPKKIRKNQKFAKLRGFLFFLFLAIVFWALTKFSREFTSTIYMHINYQNIPETTALAKNNIHQLSFDITANGFDLLFYKIKKPSIKVPVSDFYVKGNYEIILSRNQLSQLIWEDFNDNISIKNLSQENLVIKLDPVVFKKVKVISKVDITFAEGFKPVDTVQLIPDSVTVSGPSGSLKELVFVETELISAVNLKENINIKTTLVKPSSNVISISPAEVEVRLEVVEFSEGEVVVPIEVVNVPPGMNIKIIPQSIIVSFNASIIGFNSISATNFRVECDFSTRNIEENFMIPKLVKKPQGVLNHEFDTQKIDFLIIK